MGDQRLWIACTTTTYLLPCVRVRERERERERERVRGPDAIAARDETTAEEILTRLSKDMLKAILVAK